MTLDAALRWVDKLRVNNGPTGRSGRGDRAKLFRTGHAPCLARQRQTRTVRSPGRICCTIVIPSTVFRRRRASRSSAACSARSHGVTDDHRTACIAALGRAAAPRRPGGAAAPVSEFQLKAVFLFNFAQFVEWPAAALPRAGAPFVIGVLGKDPFGPILDEVVQGETVNGHPLRHRALSRCYPDPRLPDPVHPGLRADTTRRDSRGAQGTQRSHGDRCRRAGAARRDDRTPQAGQQNPAAHRSAGRQGEQSDDQLEAVASRGDRGSRELATWRPDTPHPPHAHDGDSAHLRSGHADHLGRVLRLRVPDIPAADAAQPGDSRQGDRGEQHGGTRLRQSGRCARGAVRLQGAAARRRRTAVCERWAPDRILSGRRHACACGAVAARKDGYRFEDGSLRGVQPVVQGGRRHGNACTWSRIWARSTSTSGSLS